MAKILRLVTTQAVGRFVDQMKDGEPFQGIRKAPQNR